MCVNSIVHYMYASRSVYLNLIVHRISCKVDNKEHFFFVKYFKSVIIIHLIDVLRFAFGQV